MKYKYLFLVLLLLLFSSCKSNKESATFVKIKSLSSVRGDLMKKNTKKTDRETEYQKAINNKEILLKSYLVESNFIKIKKSETIQFQKLIDKNNDLIQKGTTLRGNKGCAFQPGYCITIIDKDEKLSYILCLTCNQYKLFINNIFQNKLIDFDFVALELKTLISKIDKSIDLDDLID